MKTITTYEIVDYGIYGDQYFQGHGVSFTEYEYCALGAGDNYTEALEDALEQAAMMGYKIEFSDEDKAAPASFSPSAQERHTQYCDEEDHSDCESDLYYYVGLRW